MAALHRAEKAFAEQRYNDAESLLLKGWFNKTIQPVNSGVSSYFLFRVQQCALLPITEISGTLLATC